MPQTDADDQNEVANDQAGKDGIQPHAIKGEEVVEAETLTTLPMEEPGWRQ